MTPAIRRAFMLLHAVLGGVLLMNGVLAVLHALHELDGRHGHLALVGSLETAEAVEDAHMIVVVNWGAEVRARLRGRSIPR